MKLILATVAKMVRVTLNLVTERLDHISGTTFLTLPNRHETFTQCWANVYDVSPTFNQHWVNSLYPRDSLVVAHWQINLGLFGVGSGVSYRWLLIEYKKTIGKHKMWSLDHNMCTV